MINPKRKQGITFLLNILLIPVLLVASVMVVKADFIYHPPKSGAGVTPYEVDFPGDRVCPTGYLVSDQFQSLGTGTFSETYLVDGKEVTVEITSYADNTFDFEVFGGVMNRLFVKSRLYLLYDYDNSVGPVANDTGLHPNEKPNGDGYQNVSHLDFCLTPQGDPLTATKTAEGSYIRTVEWTLEKTVNDDYHSGVAGEVAGDSIWTVTTTKTETFGDYTVEGIITVENTNNFAVPFTIEDTLDDGTVADVTCPADEVPADDSIECTYTALPEDDSAILNTAIVSSGDPIVEGDTATAPVTWEEILDGYDTADLYDPYAGISMEEAVTLDSSFSLDVPETFVCPADASVYEDGAWSKDFVNTAYLNGNLGLEASETVTVDCELQPLDPSKTANGSYDRTVEWELEKSVNNDYHEGYAGEVAGSSTWNVLATKSETLDNYKVTGTITIDNPAAIDQAFVISDELDDGTVADVDCDSYIVPAGDSVECAYTAKPDDASAEWNFAYVTAAGNPTQQTMAAVSFTENLIGFDEGTLSDPYAGLDPTIISETTSKDVPETFTCSADATDYTNGTYTEEIVNTAFLNGNLKLEASATVTVVCNLDALVPSKTADASYDRTVEWTLDKSVSPAAHYGLPGEIAGSSTWTVVADKTVTLGNYLVTGTISIYNPGTISQTFTVSDKLDDGTSASVSCPANTVATGDTVVCTYTASPTGNSATKNTAAVSAPGNPTQYAFADVIFDVNQIGYDSGTLSDARFDFSALISGDTTKTFSEDFVCPALDQADYIDGEYEYQVINTAVLNGNIGLEDSATVTVRCEEVQKPSIEVYDVVISAASKAEADQFADGTFVIQNASGGNNTLVTLGNVWIEFISIQSRGVKGTHKASCAITPVATGFVLDPNEAKTFSFSCEDFVEVIPDGAKALKARVFVDGALNQLEENRNMLWWDTSPEYSFGE